MKASKSLQIVAASCALAVQLLAAPALSAPAKSGEVIHASCGDRSVDILRSNGSSGWSIEEDETTGTKYHLSWIEVYADEELVFSKSWGKRTGHGDELVCSATLEDPSISWVFAVTAH